MKFLHLLLVTVVASAGYCTLGIMLAWPAAALPSLRWLQCFTTMWLFRSSFPLTVAQQSWIGSSPSFGQFHKHVIFPYRLLGKPAR